jgi:prepilin signal peptidase PulO-like enzyme (type II secretory pathway)
MGNGDIKLSAVIGLALGVLGYVQAMVVMALITIVLLIVLKLTKKGGWKTQAPMGPMLSAGTLITILFPLMNSIFVL